MKKVFSLIIALALIFAALFSLSSCFYVNSSEPNYVNYRKYDNAEKYMAGGFSYSSSGIEKVEIDWVAGEVNATATESDILSVYENGTSLAESEQLHYYSDGKTLIIKYCKSLFRGVIDPEQKSLNIEIPHGVELEITSVSADVFSGKLDMKDIRISNISGDTTITAACADDIDISSVSGDIFVSHAKATDNLEFESVSGDIRNNRAEAGTIKAGSVSGDVELGIFDAAAVDIDTTSGDIVLTLIGDIGIDLDFSTTSGKHSAESDYKTGAKRCTVKVKTVSGDLSTKRNSKV